MPLAGGVIVGFRNRSPPDFQVFQGWVCINLYPAKGKAMAMSAATTSLEWPD